MSSTRRGLRHVSTRKLRDTLCGLPRTAAQVRTEPVDSVASLLGLTPEDMQGRARGLPTEEDAALRSFAHRLAARSKHPRRAPLRIVVYGTSITAGVMLGRYGGNFSFSRLLEARLQRRYGSTAVTVSTFGYNAATLNYMHNCVDSLLSTPADLCTLPHAHAHHRARTPPHARRETPLFLPTTTPVPLSCADIIEYHEGQVPIVSKPQP